MEDPEEPIDWDMVTVVEELQQLPLITVDDLERIQLGSVPLILEDPLTHELTCHSLPLVKRWKPRGKIEHIKLEAEHLDLIFYSYPLVYVTVEGICSWKRVDIRSPHQGNCISPIAPLGGVNLRRHWQDTRIIAIALLTIKGWQEDTEQRGVLPLVRKLARLPFDYRGQNWFERLI